MAKQARTFAAAKAALETLNSGLGFVVSVKSRLANDWRVVALVPVYEEAVDISKQGAQKYDLAHEVANLNGIVLFAVNGRS